MQDLGYERPLDGVTGVPNPRISPAHYHRFDPFLTAASQSVVANHAHESTLPNKDAS